MDPSDDASQSTRDAANQSTRDADLAAFFQDVVRLDDPSPAEQEQRQRHARPAPSPLVQQQQPDQRYATMFPGMASLPPALQPMMSPMVQQFQTVRQYWPQPAMYASPWEEIASSSHAPIRAMNAFVGCYVPTQSASPYQPVAASSMYNLSVSAGHSQYQPVPSASSTGLQYPHHYHIANQAASASQYQYQPAPSASNTGVQYQQHHPIANQPAPSAINTGLQYQQHHPIANQTANANQYQYQPAPSAISTDSLQYQQHHPIANQTAPSEPDYGSRINQRLAAIRAQAPAARRGRTLDETRLELLGGNMDLQLVTFPDSAAHVVWLLEEEWRVDCRERIRQSVLAGVTRRIHDFIDEAEGQEVLAALLRACAGRYAEVRAIVGAATTAHNPNGRHSLLRLTKNDDGETLKELITAAAPYADLCAMLVAGLRREGVLFHDRADIVLHDCFVTMRYEDTVILVNDALKKFNSLINSETSSGSKCLVECYSIARGNQLHAFQKIILENAHGIAMGKYSNFFIQHVLQYSDDEMRHHLIERLIHNVVILSLDCYGSYVMETCLQETGQLRRVLAAFLRLDDGQLADLVEGQYSNYVVRKLLDATKDRFPREAAQLAWRIDGLLPKMKKNNMYVNTVIAVVKKITTGRYGRMYHG